jgi:hypothetical protein
MAYDPKYESVVRKMIQHEDAVINHRVTWMCTLNGLLFTAIGLLWDKSPSRLLMIIIGCLGFVVSLVSLILLMSATKAMARLRLWWKENKPSDYSGPGVMGLESMGPAPFHWISNYLNPWDFLAASLLVAWSAFLIWYVRGYVLSH